MRYHPAESGRPATSLPPEGSPARHILPAVALAGPAVAPRASCHREVWVCVQLEARRGVRESVPLPKSWNSRYVGLCGVFIFYLFIFFYYYLLFFFFLGGGGGDCPLRRTPLLKSAITTTLGHPISTIFRNHRANLENRNSRARQKFSVFSVIKVMTMPQFCHIHSSA